MYEDEDLKTIKTLLVDHRQSSKVKGSLEQYQRLDFQLSTSHDLAPKKKSSVSLLNECSLL